MDLTFLIIDYSFLRKIKPIQNLLLFFGLGLWLLIIPIGLLSKSHLSKTFFTVLILISACSFVIFLTLFLALFFYKKLGYLSFNTHSNELNIQGFKQSIPFKNITIYLNTHKDITDPTFLDYLLKTIPKHGNYIIAEYGNEQLELEFYPKLDVLRQVINLPITLKKARDSNNNIGELLKDILHMLWS